jgi:hypothetical protein
MKKSDRLNRLFKKHRNSMWLVAGTFIVGVAFQNCGQEFGVQNGGPIAGPDNHIIVVDPLQKSCDEVQVNDLVLDVSEIRSIHGQTVFSLAGGNSQVSLENPVLTVEAAQSGQLENLDVVLKNSSYFVDSNNVKHPIRVDGGLKVSMYNEALVEVGKKYSVLFFVDMTGGIQGSEGGCAISPVVTSLAVTPL